MSTFVSALSSRDSSVSTATGYGRDSISGSARLFSYPQRPERLWGPPSLVSNAYWWLFPRGVVFFLVSLGGVRLSPLGTSATVGLSRMIDDVDYGAVGGMRIGRGSRNTRRKPAAVPLRPPQIPHNLTWDQTRAAAVGSQRLSPGVKRQGREADHSPPSSADVKKGGAMPPLPMFFCFCVLFFIFTLVRRDISDSVRIKCV
jgi:hypothetical protein